MDQNVQIEKFKLTRKRGSLFEEDEEEIEKLIKRSKLGKLSNLNSKIQNKIPIKPKLKPKLKVSKLKSYDKLDDELPDIEIDIEKQNLSKRRKFKSDLKNDDKSKQFVNKVKPRIKTTTKATTTTGKVPPKSKPKIKINNQLQSDDSISLLDILDVDNQNSSNVEDEDEDEDEFTFSLSTTKPKSKLKLVEKLVNQEDQIINDKSKKDIKELKFKSIPKNKSSKSSRNIKTINMNTSNGIGKVNRIEREKFNKITEQNKETNYTNEILKSPYPIYEIPTDHVETIQVPLNDDDYNNNIVKKSNRGNVIHMEKKPRRLSLSFRGKRLSNIKGNEVLPHDEIPINEYHNHLDPNLPTPHKLKTLLIWICKKLLSKGTKGKGKCKDEVKIKELLKNVEEGTLDINWWGGEEVELDDETKDRIKFLKEKNEELSNELKTIIKLKDNNDYGIGELEIPKVPEFDEICNFEKQSVIKIIDERTQKLSKLMNQSRIIEDLSNRVIELRNEVLAFELKNECKIDPIELLRML